MRGPRAERPLAFLALGTGLLVVCIGIVAVTWSKLDSAGVANKKPPAPRSKPSAPSSPALATTKAKPPSEVDFLGSLPRAAASWSQSRGPVRIVVDQVYLVPDMPTFFEAIGEWDERHYFPILIDDPSWTLPFLRAFRPSRVVRLCSVSAAQGGEGNWSAAVRAVGRSWLRPSQAVSKPQDGAMPPQGLGRTPPGVVLSEPDSSSLPGAVALAAGRFQPLVRLDDPTREATSKGGDRRKPNAKRDAYSIVLSLAEARGFAKRVEERVAAVVPEYGALGDGCDFVTLAADWPYRYMNDQEEGRTRGEAALDDLVGRILEPDPTKIGKSKERWAFTGRLIGDHAASVYRAMCSLFLPPNSALLWNTYGDSDPWKYYGMNKVAEQLARLIPGPLRHRAGPEANLLNWHQFAPESTDRTRLVFFNSSGEPRRFAIEGGAGRPADIPPGGPSAVVMVHSFSAANPSDSRTIAGRWLALGAFVYFGSMNEPYLNAFRPPLLIVELLSAGIPLGAAVREGRAEAFGQPWRLAYLGDPFYCLDLRLLRESSASSNIPIEDQEERIDPVRWDGAKNIQSDQQGEILAKYKLPLPSPSGSHASATSDQLLWCFKAAIVNCCGSGAESNRPSEETLGPDWRPTLGSIARVDLPWQARGIWDALVLDAALKPGVGQSATLWYERLAKIPVEDWSPKVEAILEYELNQRIASATRSEAYAQVLTLWDQAIRRQWPFDSEFPSQLTQRVGSVFTTPEQLRDWRLHLNKTFVDLSANPADRATTAVISLERKRVESKLAE